MYSIHEQINVIYGYLHGLWRYRWSALFISWIIAIGGWLYVYSLPDVFESRAAINIDTTSVMQPLLEGLSVEINPEEEISVMTRILLSRENLLSVIRETDMDLGADTPEAREAMVRKLAGKIRISGLGSGRRGREAATIYEISYKSRSAERSFKVVFNLLNSLIENTLNSGRLDTAKAEEFLNEQIQDYEQRLTDAEERLATFKKQNVGFMPDERGGYYARVRSRQAQIDTSKSELRLAKQRFSEITQQLSGEKPLVSAGAYTSASATKMRSLQEQLNNLLVQFTEEHPDVMAVRARIEDLRKNMNRENVDTIGLGDSPAELNPIYQDLKVEQSRARVEVGALQVKLSEQRQALAELEKSIDIIPRVEADLARLNRDYDITRERYLQLVERRESARMAQKVEQSSSELIFRVVDAPVVPLLPIGPNRALLLAGAFLAALAAGLAWTVFRFLLYPTFVDFKQMQKMIEMPVLGSITLQISPETRRARRMHLTTFLLAVLFMCGSLMAAIIYSQQGSVQVRMLMKALGF
jgi:polysaccharide chain length determinant protein (PEP-CTERM system associated)